MLPRCDSKATNGGENARVAQSRSSRDHAESVVSNILAIALNSYL